MASTAFHEPTGRWLTSSYNWAKGDIVTLSFGSFSKKHTYSNGKPRWCEFTQFTLNEPVGFSESGEPLFDLNECNPVCALDVGTAQSGAA